VAAGPNSGDCGVERDAEADREATGRRTGTEHTDEGDDERGTNERVLSSGGPDSNRLSPIPRGEGRVSWIGR